MIVTIAGYICSDRSDHILKAFIVFFKRCLVTTIRSLVFSWEFPKDKFSNIIIQ